MNKKAAEFLKRRRFEISKEMGREYDPLTIREMAEMCGVNEFTLGRLEKGRGTPTLDNMRKMAMLYGNQVYSIYIDDDPEFIEFVDLYRAAKNDPNAADILRKAKLQAQAQLNNKTVRNNKATQVTFGT